MKFISNGLELSELLKTFINDHKYISFAVAWANSKTDVFKAIVANAKKIKYGAIGIHFWQTTPEALEAFIGSQKVRFVFHPKGVFHPKVYYFESLKSWDIVIGSANMTIGAFKDNIEYSIHISSKDVKKESQELAKQVLDDMKSMWARGVTIAKGDAKRYRERWKIQPSRKDRPNLSPLESNLMTITWKEYVAKVNMDKYHATKQRCDMLKAAQEQFRTHHSLIKMSLNWRKAIAGIIKNNIEDTQNLDWFLFGSINRAQPYIKYIVAETKQNSRRLKIISKALDYINMTGIISYDNYWFYIEKMQNAFNTGGLGLGIATRLLAFKRPDYFVGFNKKNGVALCKEFKLNYKEFENDDKYRIYWDKIIVPIQNSIWWYAPYPKNNVNNSQDIWNGRTAMLDAIFYES